MSQESWLWPAQFVSNLLHWKSKVLPPFTLDLLQFDFFPSLIILIHCNALGLLQSTPDFSNFQIQWNHNILHWVQRRLSVSLSLVRISHKFQFASGTRGDTEEIQLDLNQLFSLSTFSVPIISFLSDPGKPGVRSLGPDVRHKQTNKLLDVCKT